MKLFLKLDNLAVRRQEMDAAVGKMGRAFLERIGAYIMTRARRSIRSRKRASEAGSPPSSHGSGPLKHAVTFELDPAGKRVIIGPTINEKKTGAPHTLEYGGTATIKPRRKIRKLGGAGEIRLMTRNQTAYNTALGRKAWLGFHRSTKEVKGTEWMVAYAKLTTPAMVERANALATYLYGERVTKTVQVAARPYMRPAMAAETAPGTIDRTWQQTLGSALFNRPYTTDHT